MTTDLFCKSQRYFVSLSGQVCIYFNVFFQMLFSNRSRLLRYKNHMFCNTMSIILSYLSYCGPGYEENRYFYTYELKIQCQGQLNVGQNNFKLFLLFDSCDKIICKLYNITISKITNLIKPSFSLGWGPKYFGKL